LNNVEAAAARERVTAALRFCLVACA